jgi:hypothetical protein
MPFWHNNKYKVEVEVNTSKRAKWTNQQLKGAMDDAQRGNTYVRKTIKY